MSRASSRLQVGHGEWALLAALTACLPASLLLPAAWSREGGPLESLQVALLVMGCVLALSMALRAWPFRVARLALWVAPVWLLLAGRELSWGREWLGNLVWLQLLARPGAIVLLAWLLFSAWRDRIDEPLRAAFARRTPWLGLLVVLGGAMGATCAEGHMSCHLPMAEPHAQLFEELSELLAYGALCVIQHVVFQQHAARIAAWSSALPVEAKVEEAG
ncbi:hypothetical protein [Telluria beijingensis]|uniref:hypothetical protein n=1 Tax=Telluria beijingensis TaxID=3068633 RepID=UPI00279587E6|nr:hypothetical protein [Massilia sp. REN29]